MLMIVLSRIFLRDSGTSVFRPWAITGGEGMSVSRETGDSFHLFSAIEAPGMNLTRIPQIDHNFADLQRRFGYKNQHIVAILGARSWRTRWVKRNLSLFGSISIAA